MLKKQQQQQLAKQVNWEDNILLCSYLTKGKIHQGKYKRNKNISISKYNVQNLFLNFNKPLFNKTIQFAVFASTDNWGENNSKSNTRSEGVEKAYTSMQSKQ